VTANLFAIRNSKREILNFTAREELVPYMSDILLDIFQQILEGSYVASNFKKLLIIEGSDQEEFEFSPTY
jgi:hypothetical protein